MPDLTRLGFAGTPEFAATILRGLLDAGREVVLVLTQPDRPRGRGRRPAPSPVKALARAHGLDVLEPASLKGVSLAGHRLDLLIVAAYGLILPPRILSEPRWGCLNVHASLLPRWRGAAPVERAIMAGDSQTGVCLMQMDQGLDTVPLYDFLIPAIGATETGGELEARLAAAGADLLVATLEKLPTLTPRPQPPDGVTYAHKITAADSVLDWCDPAPAVARRIRALADRAPVTVYAFAPGQDRAGPEGAARVRLLGAVPGPADAGPAEPGRSHKPPGTILAIGPAGMDVACGQGTVRISRIRLDRGKGRPLTPLAAANGFPQLMAPGTRLAATPDPGEAA